MQIVAAALISLAADLAIAVILIAAASVWAAWRLDRNGDNDPFPNRIT